MSILLIINKIINLEKVNDVLHFLWCEYNADIETVSKIVCQEVCNIVSKLDNDYRITRLKHKR